MSDISPQLPSHQNDGTSIKRPAPILQVEEVVTSDDESNTSLAIDESDISSRTESARIHWPNEERNSNENSAVLSSGNDDIVITKVDSKKASHSSNIVVISSSDSDEPKSDDTEVSAKSPKRKVLRARRSARSKTKMQDQQPKAVHAWQHVAVANPQSPSSSSKPTDKNPLNSCVASESVGDRVSASPTNSNEDFDSDSSTSSIVPQPRHLPRYRILKRCNLDADIKYKAFEKMDKKSRELTKRQLKYAPIFGMLYMENGVRPDLSDSNGPYFCMPVSKKIIGFSENPVVKAMRLTSHLTEYNTLSTNVNCLWNKYHDSNYKNLIALRPCHYVRLSTYHYKEMYSLMESMKDNKWKEMGSPTEPKDTKYTTLLFLNDEWCQRNDAKLSNFLARCEGKMANVGLTNQGSYLVPSQKRIKEEKDLARIFNNVKRGCPVTPLHKLKGENDSVAYCYVVMPSKA